MKLQRYKNDFDFLNNFRLAFNDILDVDKNTLYRGAFSPPTDIVETTDAYKFHIDVPEMDEKNFTIKFDGGSLVVQGEREKSTETSNNKFTRVERQFGKFIRSWTLPDNIDTEKTTATYEKGTLTVSIPKTEQKSKTVEVKLLK